MSQFDSHPVHHKLDVDWDGWCGVCRERRDSRDVLAISKYWIVQSMMMCMIIRTPSSLSSLAVAVRFSKSLFGGNWQSLGESNSVLVEGFPFPLLRLGVEAYRSCKAS